MDFWRSLKQITMQATDGVILLRPYTMNDVDSLYDAAIESREQLAPWLPWCHGNYAREESETWVRAQIENWGKELDWGFAICNLKNGYYLGGCGINDIRTDKRAGNLGYWVRSSENNKGIATRTAKLLGRVGIEELKIIRVEIVVAAENTASQRVAEKAGATREGILRDRILLYGKYHDAIMNSFIPSDFSQPKTRA